MAFERKYEVEFSCESNGNFTGSTKSECEARMSFQYFAADPCV